jgi:hypothetical protein
MLTPQFTLAIHRELVVDLFAGGGGASTGIEQAIGRHPDVAVNHDAEAISLHTANHPQTRHFCSDVFEVDPVTVTDGQPVGLLWASPDCKHFSKAKGGKPVSKKIRSLAWVVIKWAKAVRPRVICLENVEEFQTWGPLAADGLPFRCHAPKDGRICAGWVRVRAELVTNPLPPEAAPAVWKDHDTAKLVNDLRDVAIEFHDSQQLRERIAQIVRPVATPLAQAPAQAPTVSADWSELQRLANCCPELNLSNYGPDDVDELNAWAIEVSLCIARTAAAPQPSTRKDTP